MKARDFYTAVIGAEISEEVSSYAQAAIQKMDALNETRRATLTAKQKENEQLKVKIMDAMESGQTYSAAVIGETLGISKAKASSLMGQLKESGCLTSTKGKVTNVTVANGEEKSSTATINFYQKVDGATYTPKES